MICRVPSRHRRNYLTFKLQAMPILKKEEPIPARPVIIFIYGEPGIGKTSLSNTSNLPLLIDFDRGKDRAIFRQDTLVVGTWDDIQKEEKDKTFTGYQTITIDTAKAALDDFLMTWVIKQDYRLGKNKLKAYGAIGDEFKLFINRRREQQCDIVIIAHAKEEKDGDIVKRVPDVTGSSYSLLLRIADQVGYMSMKNNRRTLQFEPTDTTIGKNVAELAMIDIPIAGTLEFKTFMAGIIDQTREALCSKSEAQQEALSKSEAYKLAISKCTDAEDLTTLLGLVKDLPQYLCHPLKADIIDKAKELKLKANKDTGKFELIEEEK